MSVDLLVRHEVSHGRDHAADLGSVLLDDDVADALEAERAQRLPLVLLPADGRAGLGHLKPRHHAPVPAARARSMAAGATCSSVSPRRAATASGRSRPRSAATVAWTMLMAFDEPSDLLSTSWMPAHSRTARTGPPAMTPVPGAAGRSMTTPADANGAVAVADHHEGGEAEAAAALDDLGHAVDGHDALDVRVLLRRRVAAVVAAAALAVAPVVAAGTGTGTGSAALGSRHQTFLFSRAWQVVGPVVTRVTGPAHPHGRRRRSRRPGRGTCCRCGRRRPPRRRPHAPAARRARPPGAPWRSCRPRGR